MFNESFLEKFQFQFLERKIAEINMNYKQLIPYTIVQFQNRYLSYQRNAKTIENRLHLYFSIGIGGHIKKSDDSNSKNIFRYALEREIAEELGNINIRTLRFVGFINDESNEVGKVHFGIVYLLKLSTINLQIKDRSIANYSFLNLDNLKKDIDNYENWSKLCINQLEEINYLNGKP